MLVMYVFGCRFGVFQETKSYKKTNLLPSASQEDGPYRDYVTSSPLKSHHFRAVMKLIAITLQRNKDRRPNKKKKFLAINGLSLDRL